MLESIRILTNAETWHSTILKPRASLMQPFENGRIDLLDRRRGRILRLSSRQNKQNKLTAKNFKANMIEEQAEVTEELIATLTEKHTQQMESLIKSTTEAMKEMMALIKNMDAPQRLDNCVG